jgi:hypothetical protein
MPDLHPIPVLMSTAGAEGDEFELCAKSGQVAGFQVVNAQEVRQRLASHRLELLLVPTGECIQYECARNGSRGDVRHRGYRDSFTAQ